jgi:hypothetical protein
MRSVHWVLRGRCAGYAPGALRRVESHHALCPARYAGSPIFGPPHLTARRARRRIPLPFEGSGSVYWRDAQAGVPSAGWPRAQLAFKDSMVRGILQFTPGIAFRYVLHRCESRDIRCRESCGLDSIATRGTASKPAAPPG